jgi:hypothetical protein
VFVSVPSSCFVVWAIEATGACSSNPVAFYAQPWAVGRGFFSGLLLFTHCAHTLDLAALLVITYMALHKQQAAGRLAGRLHALFAITCVYAYGTILHCLCMLCAGIS